MNTKTKSLHRNKACLNCRSRKTKCDAIKPICSSCKKTQSQCQYDLPPKWLESVVKSTKENQKIQFLQEKLNSLEIKLNQLKIINQKNKSASSNLISPLISSNLFLTSIDWLNHLPPRSICKILIRSFFNRPLSPFTLVEPISLQSNLDLSCFDPKFPEPALIHAICAIGSQFIPIQDLYPIYWNSENHPHFYHAKWAERLLNNAIHSFNKPKFNPLNLIQLSETAVLCCQYYTLIGKPLMIWKSLGYSIRLATLLGLHTNSNYNHNQTYPHSDLNHSPSSIQPLLTNSHSEEDLVSLWPDGIGSLENNSDHRIQHYRTILWWYVFCCDKMCAAAGGFASTMDEKDCSIPIYNPPYPTSFLMSGREINFITSNNSFFINQNQNSFYYSNSPGFFFFHQVGDFDSLQLLIKAAILLGRVNTSLYRRSHPAKSIDRIHQEYQELSNLIWGLSNSIPDCLKNPFRLNASGHLDSCLLSAHALIHTSLIQMNEDLVELNLNNQYDPEEAEEAHLKICQESGKVLIEWFSELIKLKDLGLIQVDLGGLLCGNPALNFSLSVALRTHCRFIAILKFKISHFRDLKINMLNSNNKFKNHLEKLELQINFILSHLKRSQKMPLEGRIVELITFLLNSPSTLLPKKKTQLSSSVLITPTMIPRTTIIMDKQAKTNEKVELIDSNNYYQDSNIYLNDIDNSSNYYPIKKTKLYLDSNNNKNKINHQPDELSKNYKNNCTKSIDDENFHFMISNFALSKLLNSQI